MKASWWIRRLQKDYKPSDPLVVGFWDKEFLQQLVDEDYQLTNDDVIWLAEQEYDWSSINDQLSAYIDEVIRENKEELDEELDEELEEELWDTETEKAK
jgi:dipeptidase